MIYFIRENETGNIKIGSAQDPVSRRDFLQTGNSQELHIIATLDLPDEQEKKLHKRFDKYNVRGEWFRPELELLKFIYDAKQKSYPINCPDQWHNWSKITDNGLYPSSSKVSGGLEEKKPMSPFIDQVEMCKRFLRERAFRTSAISKRLGSYTLKHVVESWSTYLTNKDGEPVSYAQYDYQRRLWTSHYLYIANGAFILAAYQEGYLVAREEPGSPYAFFNIGFHKKYDPYIHGYRHSNYGEAVETILPCAKRVNQGW